MRIQPHATFGRYQRPAAQALANMALAQGARNASGPNPRGALGSPMSSRLAERSSPRNARSHTYIQPYTLEALSRTVEAVPALAQLDPRLLALTTVHAHQAGWPQRRRPNAAGFWDDLSDPSNWNPFPSGEPSDPGVIDPTGLDTGTPTRASGSGSSDANPIDPGFSNDPTFGGGGPGGLLGEVLGNPNAPGFEPNTPGNFDPAQPGGPINPQQVPGSGTIDAGGILQAQMMLATWAAKTQAGQASAIPSYGASPSEFTGVVDARFTQELASFQVWYNAAKAGSLNTDGTLDSATYQALVQVNGEILAGNPEAVAPGAATSGSTTTILLVGAAALAALVLFKRGGKK